MGKNNKARRAAKAKQRQARAQQGAASGPGDPFGFANQFDHARGSTPGERVVELLVEIVEKHPSPYADRLAQKLAALDEEVVAAQLERIIPAAVSDPGRGGWQPFELVREMRRRKSSAPAIQVVQLGLLVHAEATTGPVDPRWVSQLRDLPMASSTVRPGWFTTWRRAGGLDRSESYLVVGEVLAKVDRLPALEVLVPAPGRPATRLGRTARAEKATAMLAKIRKLLAQAESTLFEEEALTFTAKAQELMTRHAIDEAAVHEPDPEDVPRMTRIPLDAPYADAKNTLLAVVAHANRCRAVGLTGLDLATLMGHEEDLRLVEMVFTSLLVQAQNALTELAVQGGQARRPSFRASFFLGFAHRIGERLESVNERVEHEATSTAALPVLRAREQAVDDEFESRFGDQLERVAVRGGYDPRGHGHGRQAADRALLEAGAIEG